MSNLKNWRKDIRNLFESASPDYFGEADGEPDITGDFPEPEVNDDMEGDLGVEEEPVATVTMDRELLVKLMNYVSDNVEVEDEDTTSDEGLDDVESEVDSEEEILEEEEMEGDLDDVDDSLEDEDVESEVEIDDVEDEDTVDVEALADKVVELSAEGETLTVDHFDQIVASEEEEEEEEEIGDEEEIV